MENWGVIWMLDAVSNGAGFVATHVLMHTGHTTPWPYAALWGGVLLFDGASMVLFRIRNASSGSFLEKQLWSIWTVFIVGMGLTAVINYLLGLSVLFMPAVGWGILGLVMAWFPSLQFALFGPLWFVTQGTGGALLHRARRRKLVAAAGGLPR
jgi:hypothetical protein